MWRRREESVGLHRGRVSNEHHNATLSQSYTHIASQNKQPRIAHRASHIVHHVSRDKLRQNLLSNAQKRASLISFPRMSLFFWSSSLIATATCSSLPACTHALACPANLRRDASRRTARSIDRPHTHIPTVTQGHIELPCAQTYRKSAPHRTTMRLSRGVPIVRICGQQAASTWGVSAEIEIGRTT
jgi:hypothetical protein